MEIKLDCQCLEIINKKLYCQKCGELAVWISGGQNTLCEKHSKDWNTFPKCENFGKHWKHCFIHFLLDKKLIKKNKTNYICK